MAVHRRAENDLQGQDVAGRKSRLERGHSTGPYQIL